MSEKTLAMKVLEGQKVPYEVVPYPSDMRDAEEIAAVLRVPPEQVFKTLVVLPPGTSGKLTKPLLTIVPANRQLSLKKLAQLLGVKKVKMASHQEAETITGLQVGGISALALLNKGFAIFLDESASAFAEIYVSAGQKGLDVRLKVKDLIKVTGAKVAAVT